MTNLLTFLLLTLISVQLMADENEFWSWFSKHQLDIEKYESGDEKLLDEIMSELHKYNENLYFEFSTHEKLNEFIITAEGETQQFESVFNLVNSAPKFENWKIIALKPAMGFDFITNYEGVDYNPEDLWFLPLSSDSNPNMLGLRIGIPNYDKDTHKHSVAASWIIFDAGLGEYQTTQDIHHIETVALPKDPESDDYIKVKEIENYLTWRKKNT